jgi:hypothetical protein
MRASSIVNRPDMWLASISSCRCSSIMLGQSSTDFVLAGMKFSERGGGVSMGELCMMSRTTLG